jgi:hypothetical protein
MIWSYRGSDGGDPDWLDIRLARGEQREPLVTPRYRDRAGSVNAFADAVAGRIAAEGLPQAKTTSRAWLS